MNAHKDSLRKRLSREELLERLAMIEHIAKPLDISMSGKPNFISLGPPKVEQIWRIANEALNADT